MEIRSSRKWGLCLAAFSLTALVLIVVIYVKKLYPFGNNSFLIWDMKLQYVDFFSWLKRVMNGEANLFYSFGKSLGDNTFGLFAYYLSSPFNLLLLLFNDIQMFITVLVVTKLAVSALTCSVFLVNRFKELQGIWNVLLSVSYALMEYGIQQSSNVMWLDGMVILPLMLLGVYRFVSGNKKSMLYISVIAAIIMNWYTAYMCCLFSVIYFLYELTKRQPSSCERIVKRYIIPFIQYCVVMILAVGTTMFFFLPTILNLLQGKGAVEANIFTPGFRCGLVDILKGLLPGICLRTDGITLVLFCGSLVTIVLFLYIFSQRVQLKDKLVSIFLLVFLIFSAVFLPTENIWNGLRKVASYYCRFTFVISFFMLYLAACYLEVQKNVGKFVRVFSIVLVMGELGYNASTVWGNLASGDAAYYNRYAAEENALVEKLKGQDFTPFYRIEQTSSRGTREGNYMGTYNEGMAYGFSPLASYSSTYNQNLVNFYANCGYGETRRLILYNEPILLSDAILGIKYVMSSYDIPGFKRKGEEKYNGKGVYENPYAISLGVEVGKKVCGKIKARNCFDYQNRMLSKIVGRKVECFKKAEARLEESDQSLEWRIQTPKCENILYGYLTKREVNQVDIYINDNFRTFYSEWSSYRTFCISEDKRGEIQKVSMVGNILNSDGIKGVFYYLDMKEFRKVMAEIKNRQFEPKVFKDGYVKGSYYAEKAGKLLLTVPYDEGWVITCNGKKLKAGTAAETFYVIPIEKGKNEIEMRYTTPGLYKGIILSILSIGVFGLWNISVRCKKKNEQEENDATGTSS